MTIHYDYKDYFCPNCETNYIPYYKNFKCPKCKKSVDGYFDFIGHTVANMKYNYLSYGIFAPPAWFNASKMEGVMFTMSMIFEAIRDERPEDNKKFIIDGISNEMEFDKGCEYQKEYYLDIAMRILDIYEKKDGFRKTIEERERKQRMKEDERLINRFKILFGLRKRTEIE